MNHHVPRSFASEGGKLRMAATSKHACARMLVRWWAGPVLRVDWDD